MSRWIPGAAALLCAIAGTFLAILIVELSNENRQDFHPIMWVCDALIFLAAVGFLHLALRNQRRQGS